VRSVHLVAVVAEALVRHRAPHVIDDFQAKRIAQLAQIAALVPVSQEQVGNCG
jgi:hypothetical protein